MGSIALQDGCFPDISKKYYKNFETFFELREAVMKHTRRVFPAALLSALLAVLLLSACGPSNNVRLLSPPPLDLSLIHI